MSDSVMSLGREDFLVLLGFIRELAVIASGRDEERKLSASEKSKRAEALCDTITETAIDVYSGGIATAPVGSKGIDGKDLGPCPGNAESDAGG